MEKNKSTIVFVTLILLVIMAFLSVKLVYNLTGENAIFEHIEKIEVMNPGKDSMFCSNWNDSIFNLESNLAAFEKCLVNSNEYQGVHKKVFPIHEELVLKIKTRDKVVNVKLIYAGPNQPVYFDVMWPRVYVDERRSYEMAKFLNSLCEE